MSQFLIRYRFIVLLTAVAITAFMGFHATKIKFDYNIESYFDENDPELNYYLEHKKSFGNDFNFILVGLSSEEIDHQFLSKLDTISKSLKRLELITNVRSITNIKEYVASPLGTPVGVPLFHLEDASKTDSDLSRLLSGRTIYSNLISKDTSSVLLILEKQLETSKIQNDRLLVDIESILEANAADQFQIAGRIKTQNFYVEIIGSELAKLSLLSLLLIVVFLYILYRRIGLTAVPLVALTTSLVWTFGFIQLTGGKLDVAMTVLPSLLFVIGISNTIHLLSTYISKRNSGYGKHESILHTFKEIGLATFLTSLTTAIGFYSLMLIEVIPVRNFGFYTGSGILVTYVVSITLVPLMLLSMNDERLCRVKKGNNYGSRLFERLINLHGKQQNWILGVSGFVLVVSVLFIPCMRINNYFLDDLPPSSELKNSLSFFENEFAGIRPFEIGISNEDSTVLTLSSLRELEKLENYLSVSYGLKMIISPVTLVKAANKAVNGGDAKHYMLPVTEQGIAKALRFIRNPLKSGKFKNVISQDHKLGRISGKINDLGSSKLKLLNAHLQHWLIENEMGVSVRLTGGAYLMDKTNQTIAYQLTKGLALALGLVWLVLLLLFKSFKVATLSMIPNILPLVVIMGMMGLFGIDLKVTTALIFTMAFGISVDDTIHLMTHYRQKIKLGTSSKIAVQESLQTTGRAILFTSFILSAGFLILMFSSIQSTFFMGLFVSITLLLAVTLDILLLPVLLLKFAGNNDKNKDGL